MRRRAAALQRKKESGVEPPHSKERKNAASSHRTPKRRRAPCQFVPRRWVGHWKHVLTPGRRPWHSLRSKACPCQPGRCGGNLGKSTSFCLTGGKRALPSNPSI